MRELTADERDIVAGGWRSSDYLDDMLDEVVAWGRRSPWADMPYFYFYNPGGAGSASGGGGGGEADNTPDVRDVTCIELKPKLPT